MVRIKNRSNQASESNAPIARDYGETASTRIIRNEEPVVKQKNSDRDSDGRQLSEGQWEYFKDSVVRDADENLLVMYHGTPNVVFTEFHSGTYFTQNPEYAALYQDPGASMLRVKRNTGISTISVVRLSWTLTVLAGTRFRRFPIIKAPLVKLNR